MKKTGLFCLAGILVSFILSGCVVRTYEATKDRIDQNLSDGNRGYLKGSTPSSQETPERKTTRVTRVVEIEIHPPIRFEKAPKIKTDGPLMAEQKTQDNEIYGNQGYITKSISSEISEPQAEGNCQKYTVQKNDTLQKISKKFYGTTKKWMKIYNANKEAMKGPNKIYPGQVINVPELPSFKTELKEPKENLK